MRFIWQAIQGAVDVSTVRCTSYLDGEECMKCRILGDQLPRITLFDMSFLALAKRHGNDGATNGTRDHA